VLHREIHATVVLARGDVEVASWPLEVEGRIDLTAVDQLARMQLAAQRLGCSIRLRRPSSVLCELLELSGLRIEVFGKAELGEQARVDEVVMPDDLVP
jgi:hypothetical protein